MAESSFCNVTIGLEDFKPPYFVNTRTITFSHTRAPRFGHTNDIMTFVTGTDEERMDYLRGLVAASIFVFGVFTIWTMALIFFKCRGPEKYGWLSGRRRPLPPRPSEKEQDDKLPMDENEVTKEHNLDSAVGWDAHYEKIQHHNKFMKCMVFLGCFFVIISAILSVTKGAEKVRQTADAAQVSLVMAADLLNKTDRLLAYVIDAITNFQNDVISLLESANGICPNVLDKICENLERPQTCNTTGIFDALGIDDVIEHFSSTRPLRDRLEEFRDDITVHQTRVLQLDEKVENFTIPYVISSVFATLLCCLCFYLILALVTKKTRMMKCLQHFLVFPLFILLVTLSFVFSLVFIIGSLALSDLCIDSPDDRLRELFRIKYGDDVSQMLYEFIVFYLSQCQAPPKKITADVDFLLAGTTLVTSFWNELVSFQERNGGVCGATAVNIIGATARRLDQHICTAAGILRDVRLLLRCETWYPVYQSIMHNAVCFSATDAFSWVAATQFVIAFMAIIVLTFRAALWDVEVMEGVSDLELEEEEEGIEVEYKAESLGDLEKKCSGTLDLSPESTTRVVEEKGASNRICQVILVCTGQVVENTGVGDGMCQIILVDDGDEGV